MCRPEYLRNRVKKNMRPTFIIALNVIIRGYLCLSRRTVYLLNIIFSPTGLKFGELKTLELFLLKNYLCTSTGMDTQEKFRIFEKYEISLPLTARHLVHTASVEAMFTL